MDYFATDDILLNKKNAEDCYKIRRLEAILANKSTIKSELVLVIFDDYETNRYVISEPDEQMRQLEAMILSSLTGKNIEIPRWEVREAELMKELNQQ